MIVIDKTNLYCKMMLEEHSSIIIYTILTKHNINYGAIEAAKINHCISLYLDTYKKLLYLHKVIKYLMINADYKSIKTYIVSFLFDLDMDEIELLESIMKLWQKDKIIKHNTLENIELFQQGKIDITTYREKLIANEILK